MSPKAILLRVLWLPMSLWSLDSTESPSQEFKIFCLSSILIFFMKILCYDCMESTYNIIFSLKQKFKPILEKANINHIHIKSLKRKCITKGFLCSNNNFVRSLFCLHLRLQRINQFLFHLTLSA